jgi:hypothetical protein
VEFDVDGNGTVDLTSPGIPAAGVEATYSSAGTVRPRVTFKDASGTVLYTTTKQVHIVDPADKYSLVKGVFTEMLGRLSAGNNAGASTALTSSASEKYAPIFDALGSAMPSIAGQLGTIQRATFTNGIAEIMLTRTGSNGQSTAYFIYMFKGQDGIWRIDGM